MTAKLAAREVVRWITESAFVRGELMVERLPNEYRISFKARTTKTRASSILTRMGHVVGEVCQDRQWFSSKFCLGNLPTANDQLGDWKFVVSIKVRQREVLSTVHVPSVHERVRV